MGMGELCKSIGWNRSTVLKGDTDEGAEADPHVLPHMPQAHKAKRASTKKEIAASAQLGPAPIQTRHGGLRQHAKVGAEEVCQDSQKDNTYAEMQRVREITPPQRLQGKDHRNC